MTNKKFLETKTRAFLFGLAAMTLVFGLAVFGCDSGSSSGGGGGGGGVELPANLQNTSWTGSPPLTFTATTVTRSDTSVTYTVASAVENGQIVLNDPRGDTKDFCNSYSINSNTLTLTGGDFEGTYTKVQ
jgi:hypothetical protein